MKNDDFSFSSVMVTGAGFTDARNLRFCGSIGYDRDLYPDDARRRRGRRLLEFAKVVGVDADAVVGDFDHRRPPHAKRRHYQLVFERVDLS